MIREGHINLKVLRIYGTNGASRIVFCTPMILTTYNS